MFFPLITALLQVAAGVIASAGNQQLQAPASATAEKDKCVVSGRVSSMQTGEPLKKANLQLILQVEGRRATTQYQMSGYSSITGPDGSFKFEGVEPGEYMLLGQRSGYVSTSYGSKGTYSQGTTISLQPGQQVSDLKFQLIQQATISGHVVDEDGDPVGGLRVQALGQMGTSKGKPRYFGRGTATTDETGAFRIANLRPGRYYLSALSGNRGMMGMTDKAATPGKPDIEQVRTFYPSSLDRAGSTAIDVAPGQEVPGVEIRMRSVETFHVRGKIAGELEKAAGQPTMVELMADSEDRLAVFTSTAMVGEDHNFEFAHVQPGAYVVMMANFDEQQKQFARTKVEVGNADVNGVVLTPQSGFTLRGSVELQGIQAKDAKDKPAENIGIFLFPDDNGGMFSNANATTKADGSFALTGIMPGKFNVSVNNEPDGAYVKSIRFGGQEVLGKTLDLTQAAGGEIHVVIRAGAPDVTGTVSVKTDSGVKPANSASVLFIPEDLTLNGGSVRTERTNQNGAFVSKAMQPGTYYALAFDLDEYRGFDDPAVLKQLASKGTKIELKENDNQQLPLTLLAAGDLQVALAAGAGN